MSPSRRIAITGIGMVTPLGCSLESTLEALGRGDSAIGPVSLFDARGFREPCAAEVRQFSARDHFRVPKAMKLTDRAARFAIAAAAMALGDAGWNAEESAHENLGVVIGVSGSDLQAADLGRAIGPDQPADIPSFARCILSGLNPLWLLVNLPNMSSAHVGIQLEARGPNSTIMTDWVAGSQAIGEAFEWIRTGEADAVLAGGADSAVYPFAYLSYEQAGLFSRDPVRFVPAEGAAMLMLEEWDRARERGARIRGEILAYATASSPVPAVWPDESPALTRTLRAVLSATGWGPDDIRGLVPPAVHASRFMAVEEAALSAVFGSCLETMPRWEYKSLMGHAHAASGPIDLALALTSCARSPAPATLGDGLVCSALGYSGQAATIAVKIETQNSKLKTEK